MRYQKRTSLLGDFVRLNVSGSGVSVSLGVAGARVHIPLLGGRKPGYTVGLPGTGLSQSGSIRKPDSK